MLSVTDKHRTVGRADATNSSKDAAAILMKGILIL